MEESFLQSIFDDRNDVASRHAYADWLLEDGAEARSEAIRREAEAVAVMGGSAVHGILDVERLFGVRYTQEHFLPLRTMPFSAATLRECRDTHVLVAGYPLSLIGLRGRAFCRALVGFVGSAWYHDEPFAREEMAVRWHLIRKEPVPGSPGKTYEDQLLLLRPDEEVPKACEVAFATLIHHWTTGEYLFETMYVRTLSATSVGGRVDAGLCGSTGLFIQSSPYNEPDDQFGLASARRP